MKISREKTQKLYDAIYNPIMDLRIKTERDKGINAALNIDYDLYKLEIEIWRRVKEALDISGV